MTRAERFSGPHAVLLPDPMIMAVVFKNVFFLPGDTGDYFRINEEQYVVNQSKAWLLLENQTGNKLLEGINFSCEISLYSYIYIQPL